MKKFAFGFACVLAGCAAGAAMPHVTAQTFAPNTSAQKWDQFCELVPNARRMHESLNELVVAKGHDGWELVGLTSGGDGISVCFKRPAP